MSDSKTKIFKVKLEFPKEFNGKKIDYDKIAELIDMALTDGIYNAYNEIREVEDDDLFTNDPEYMMDAQIVKDFYVEEVRP